MSYEKNYLAWEKDPISFWQDKAKKISWIKPWKKVLLEKNKSEVEWFHGGTLNTCYNCLDRHVERGSGHKDAIIYDSPVSNTKKKNYIQ